MLRPVALAFALLVVSSCAPPPPPAPSSPQSTAAQACEQRGGTLRAVGRMQTLQCVISYADAGKRCTSGDQCQGDCRTNVDPIPAEGAPIAGVCQATSDRFGCYTIVENGRAEATICVD